MRRIVLLVLLLLFFGPGLLSAQQRPLVTERPETLNEGQALLDLGLGLFQNTKFTLSGLQGDLVEAGSLGFRVAAAANVEIQVLGTIQNILNVESRFAAPNRSILDFSGNSTSNVGNFMLATKVLLARERGRRPILAFRFGMELPNTSNEKGLGNDETNVFGSLLLGKQLGKLRWFASTGIAILGDPVQAGAQDDLFTYGVALTYPVHPQVQLVGDFYGREGPGGIGTEDQTRIRVGAQVKAGGLYWDAALFLGFRDTDPDSGVIVGISKEFRLFGSTGN